MMMAQATAPLPQAYFRSDSSDSAAHMLGEKRRPRRRQKRCSPVWLAVGAMGILAVQIAAATGLFVYFSMSVAKLRTQVQGSSEELRCLVLLNSLQDLDQLPGNYSCFKLARSIKAYVAMVTDNVIRKTTQQDASDQGTNASSDPSGGRASAHLTLRGQRPAQAGSPGAFGELPQSCQQPIRSWATGTVHSHLQNLTYQDGQLHINQPGKYYIYAQIYFRYSAESAASRTTSHQLVECINLQSSAGESILLLKGVGTKCWTQDATYGLFAVHQGGLFELQAGDKLFVSVSSLTISYNDEAGSYFGAFRLDV